MSGYQLLPPLSAAELRELRDSIKQFGVQVPIIVDETGAVLDGHNRKKIADELGVECPQIVRSGLPEHEKRILAAELNIARRQLTDAQKVIIGRSIEPDIAERARVRQGVRTDLAEHGGQVSTKSEDAGKTRDEVARTVGLGSGRTYERHKRVIEELEKQPDGEQLIQHIESGDWDIPDAKTELKQRGVDLSKPANVTALPSLVERLPESTVDAWSADLYRIQLPHVVDQTVNRAASYVRQASVKARQELQTINWDDVSDAMRQSKSVLDSLSTLDAEMARFDEAMARVRVQEMALRRVK